MLGTLYGVAQFIQARSGTKAAVKEHDVSPRRIIAESTDLGGFDQRSIADTQLPGRIEYLLVVAVVSDFDG